MAHSTAILRSLSASTECRPSGACFCSPSRGVVACLPEGVHLVFIGDSTMRYQYLMLAAALTDGTEYVRTHGQQLIFNEHSFCTLTSDCTQSSWGSWTRFFNVTNALLNHKGPAKTAEHCDCYRADCFQPGCMSAWGKNFGLVTENVRACAIPPTAHIL